MDKPTNPAGPNPPNPSWPEDSGSGQSFGATGIFGTVNEAEAVKKSVDISPEPDPLAKWLSEPIKPQPVAPSPTTKDFAEPVVHKVVFGGGAAENSPQLLDRMRQASAERAAAEKTPATETGNGSGGFTELLRTLSSEPAAPPVAPAPVPPQSSGFTSLLKTLGSPEQPEAPYKRVPPASAPSAGGFTELLRTDSAGAQGYSSPGSTSWSEPAHRDPLPSAGSPGEFTKMFGAFSGGSSSAPQEPATPPQSRMGSFTKMLSIDQQTAPAPAFQEVRGPLPGPIDYGQAPRAETAAPSRDPFASSPAPEPPHSAPGGSGMGITRLIQMLDEPAKMPAPRFEPAPVNPPPSGPEPGEWTKTFASLSQSNEIAPPAKAPEWTPTQPAYSAPPPVAQPPVSKPAAPAGPSEFTRILDASRVRELSMQGGAAAAPAPSAPPQSFAPAAPPMPSFQMPAPPPMQMPGGMPQAGGFAPPQAPQVPTYPMSYAPPAGGMPQVPGMQMPSAPPMPQVPQTPAIKPPDPPAGKTQQLLVVMGVVIIVLLVAILVTVIFLMKH